MDASDSPLQRPSPDNSPVSAPLGPTLILSGGTGYNDLVCSTWPHPTTYVLPISDNGGSSSEIIRCLGGPSIGDIRSRLVRLIPLDVPIDGKDPGHCGGNEALRTLLSYRLPMDESDEEVSSQWQGILQGCHAIWKDVDEVRGSIIRGFITHFHKAISPTTSPHLPPFDLHGLSIGNAFLSSCARTFDSLQSAIWLFCNVARIDTRLVRAIPCVETTDTSHIAAELESAEIIVGQCEISHPAKKREGDLSAWPARELLSPSSRPAVKRTNSNLVFTKGVGDDIEMEPLPSRIRKIHYVSPASTIGDDGVTQPKLRQLSANPAYMTALQDAETLIFSCGSLYTSIVPLLILQGVGKNIAHSKRLQRKILLLNTQMDRETRGYDAVDFIAAITDACSDSMEGSYTPRELITHLVYHPGGQIPVDVPRIEEELDIRCVAVAQRPGEVKFTEDDVRGALNEIARDEDH